MSKKNPEYDFKWCPGCGDFGVKRGLEMAIQQWVVRNEEPIEKSETSAFYQCLFQPMLIS